MKKLLLEAAATSLLVAAGAASAQSDSLEAGKKVYEAHCVQCHDSGKMGAPVLSDASVWEGLTMRRRTMGGRRWRVLASEETTGTALNPVSSSIPSTTTNTQRAKKVEQ